MNEPQILNLMIASLPTTLTVLIGILINNSRLADVNARIADLRADMNRRFDEMDRRFVEVKELWRSELHRVEEVLDARLKHLEDS